MADEKTNARIVLSRHTLSRYEAGGIEAATAGTHRLIVEEIAILRGIVAANPEKAASVGDLVRRWEALAGTLQARMH